MGAVVAKSKVIPVAQISVQPAKDNPEDRVGNSQSPAEVRRTSSLESSMRTTLYSGGERHSSSDATLRAESRLSRRNPSGRGSSSRGCNRVLSGNRWTVTRGGLPLQRDLDLNSSGYSQRDRRVPPLRIDQDSESSVVLLGKEDDIRAEYAATCCQLCGHVFSTLHIPLLLLCGHSYCDQCIHRATERYPSALKCGVCSIVTPLGQQNSDNLPKNESIFDLVTSREFTSIVTEKNVDKCAECIHHQASVYCSECSASYCSTCSKKAHEGSRVRSKHKPVPVNLKPRPQPTCRKHPGQSCVLYCETERQPMCVLCKFYNQHRFHKFDLLSKVASKYTTTVTERLSKLDQMEKDLSTTAVSLALAVDEVNNNARKVQERLERHCSELQKSYCMAIERREAVLLTLLDRQVEVKQDMIEEARTEVAAARARILAAKEEAGQLLKLNPVTALLSRQHMDANFDRALKRTMLVIKQPTQPEVPLSLLPDITPTINETLGQHGAILQLPSKPSFHNVAVTTNTISLQWECPQEDSSDVSMDRTLTYSLHCHADVPFRLKSKISFKKQIVNSGMQITPESGFEDFSGSSVEPSTAFPSVPQSLLGSRNISLIAIQPSETKNTGMMQQETPPNEVHEPAVQKNPHDQLPNPKLQASITTKLPEIIKPGPGIQAIQHLLPSSLPSSSSAAKLNLPPLKQTQETLAETETDQLSDSTSVSGTLADSEDPCNSPIPYYKTTSTVGAKKSRLADTYSTDSTSSHSETTSGSSRDPTFTNVGRFCRGFAFDEIYCGKEKRFLYSGLLPGATYYFRVHCHNAAGWGPWSDTVKCTTVIINK